MNLSAPGQRTLLIFHTADTAEAAERLNQAIRAVPEYQACAAVLIANVVDLRTVPKLFRGFAEKSMRESYAKASRALPPGEKPHDYIIILPDWEGSATSALGLRDTGQTVGLAVLDAGGRVVGVYQGREPEAQALALLPKAA